MRRPCWLTQEHLIKWRELNSAQHFLKAEAAVRPLSQSLPQLVHHREQIMAHLLADLDAATAQLSLEPLLHLAAVLSRDLQRDYLPLLPGFVARVTQMLENGGSTQPDTMEHAFTALSTVFKHLSRCAVGLRRVAGEGGR